MNNNGGKYSLRRKDLLYLELSYEINGILFDVHNSIGGNTHEKYIQKAMAIGLKNKNITFQEQYYVPLKFQGEYVGKYFLDFLIDNKIVLELKRGRYIPKNIYNQVGQYLDALDLKLGIVGCFAHDCVIIKHKLLT